MRWPVLVLSLAVMFGCKKAGKPAEGSGSSEPTAVAVKTPPPAASDAADTTPPVATPPTPGLVELLHNSPSVVRVSSRVANATNLPEHAVDKNMNTAWHSHSGDLQGAWIDIDTGGAQIKEVRLTVGNVAKGVHSEDYFVMNPRIKTVSVRDGQKLVAQKTLDVDNRGLQPIVLATPASHVRVRVEDYVAGGKPGWHELCVSEIEVWGTLPAGATAAAQKPRIEVGDPPDDSATKPPIADADAYCKQLLTDATTRYKEQLAALTKDNEQCIKDHGDSAASFCGSPEPPGEPKCSMSISMPVKVNHSTWMGAGIFTTTNDETWGSRVSQLVVETQEGFWPIGDKLDCGGHGETSPCNVEVSSASVAKSGDLEVAYHVKSWAGEKDLTTTCNAGPNVTCTAPAEGKPAATP